MLLDSLDRGSPLSWTVDGFLSPDECESLIATVGSLGTAPAPITTTRGPVMRPDIRNNERLMIDDPAFAASLFERARPHVPETLRGMSLCGVNERLRFYRYKPGQRFAPHFDGAFVRSAAEESLLTFMIYLNEGFGGGQTRFIDEGRVFEPATGRALFFQHMQLHEGCEVTSGEKYVLRTDVMYRQV